MLHSDEEPISYYRVIQELNENLDLENSIVTHDAGAPRPSDLQTSLSECAGSGWVMADEGCGWQARLVTASFPSTRPPSPTPTSAGARPPTSASAFPS